MLDEGVADEPARFRDDILGQAGDLRHALIEVARRVAAEARAGERREIFAECEALGLGLRFLAEGAFAFKLGGCQRRQLQCGAEREPAAAEDQPALDQR